MNYNYLVERGDLVFCLAQEDRRWQDRIVEIV